MKLSTIATVLALSVAVSACDDKKETPKSEPTSAQEPVKKADTPPAPTAAQEPGAAPKLADAKGSYELDPAHSTIVFSAKHAGFSWTYGMFTKVTGKMNLADEPDKSSVEIEADAGSVFTAVKKRDDHLKGGDFLNATQFPKITFKSTKIEAAGDGKYKVTGELTLHGVTKPVTLKATLNQAGPHPFSKKPRLGLSATAELSRSAYGVSATPVVGDEVQVRIEVEAGAD